MKLRAQALTAARIAYGAEMVDACVVLARTQGQDAVGGALDTFDELPEMPCIFSPLTASEQARQDSTLFTVTARLRIPYGSVCGRNDRVRITRQWGSAVADGPLYEVMGDPRQTLGYVLVELAEVTT